MNEVNIFLRLLLKRGLSQPSGEGWPDIMAKIWEDILKKWTNRLKTPIFHYNQVNLGYKSKQSIDMAGPCSFLMDFDHTKAKLWRIRPFSLYFCSLLLRQDSIVVQQASIVVQQDSIVLQQDSIVVQQDSIVLRQDSTVVWEDSTAVWEDSTVVWENSTVVWEENCVRKNSSFSRWKI